MDAPIFKFEHVKANIFELDSDEEGDEYICISCPNFEFTFKCIRKHLLSKTHLQAAEDDPDHIELHKQLQSSKTITEKDLLRDKGYYLAFIDLCASLSKLEYGWKVISCKLYGL